MSRLRIHKVNSWLTLWRGCALGETAMYTMFSLATEARKHIKARFYTWQRSNELDFRTNY